MSYYVEQIKDDIYVSAENWQRFRRESPGVRPIQIDEFWLPDRSIPCSDNCEIYHLSYYSDTWNEDYEQWLECLAPYAVDGSELALRSEDGEIWGYRFEDGKLIHTKGMFVTVPQGADMKALQQALAAGELTVEQTSQLLDMLNQME